MQGVAHVATQIQRNAASLSSCRASSYCFICHLLHLSLPARWWWGGEARGGPVVRWMSDVCIAADLVAYLPKPKNSTGVNLLAGEKVEKKEVKVRGCQATCTVQTRPSTRPSTVPCTTTRITHMCTHITCSVWPASPCVCYPSLPFHLPHCRHSSL